MSLTRREQMLMRAVGAAIGKEVAPIRRQLELLQKHFGYRGTWTEGETYHRGNFVTHSGSLWHCEGEGVTSRPGTDKSWRLCVKRGQMT